jgi:hypothetical protein
MRDSPDDPQMTQMDAATAHSYSDLLESFKTKAASSI